MSQATKTYFCAFCDKSQHEVRSLISGPKVCICDECIELCGDIIREKEDRRTGRYYKNLFPKSDDANSYFISGRLYAKLGMHREAIANLDAAIRQLPNFAAAFCNRAAIHMNLGNFDHALADLDQVIHLTPIHADVYICRGNTHYEMKAFEKAIEDHSEAIRLDPTYVSAYTARGLAFEAKGDRASAVQDYRSAVAHRPNGDKEEWAHEKARERLLSLQSSENEPQVPPIS